MSDVQSLEDDLTLARREIRRLELQVATLQGAHTGLFDECAAAVQGEKDERSWREELELQRDELEERLEAVEPPSSGAGTFLWADVWASRDGQAIVLKRLRGVRCVGYVTLEPETFAALQKFLEGRR